MITRNRQILECVKQSACVVCLAGFLGETVFALTLLFFPRESWEIFETQRGVALMLLGLFVAGVFFFTILVRRMAKELSALGEDMDWDAEALCRWFVTHEDPSLAHFFFEKSLIETIKEENGCEP